MPKAPKPTALQLSAFGDIRRRRRDQLRSGGGLNPWVFGVGFGVFVFGVLGGLGFRVWEFPKIRGTLFWGPYNKDPTI